MKPRDALGFVNEEKKLADFRLFNLFYYLTTSIEIIKPAEASAATDNIYQEILALLPNLECDSDAYNKLWALTATDIKITSKQLSNIKDKLEDNLLLTISYIYDFGPLSRLHLHSRLHLLSRLKSVVPTNNKNPNPPSEIASVIYHKILSILQSDFENNESTHYELNCWVYKLCDKHGFEEENDKLTQEQLTDIQKRYEKILLSDAYDTLLNDNKRNDFHRLFKLCYKLRFNIPIKNPDEPNKGINITYQKILALLPDLEKDNDAYKKMRDLIFDLLLGSPEENNKITQEQLVDVLKRFEGKKLVLYNTLLNDILTAANACRKLGKPNTKENNTAANITYQSILSFLLARRLPYDLIMNDNEMTEEQLADIEKKLLEIYNNLLKIKIPEHIPTDDELRNINCFEYLRNLAHLIPKSVRQHEGFDNVWNLCQPKSTYNYNVFYGNHYTNFMLALEKHILYLHNHINFANDSGSVQVALYYTNDLHSFDSLVNAVYMNHNFALQRAYMLISKPIAGIPQTDCGAATAAVHTRLTPVTKTKSQIRPQNTDTPMKKEQAFDRFFSTFGAETKPMTTTNQPSIVNFAYRTGKQSQQLRFGMQGQVVDYKAHINPIFLHWLDSKQRALNPNSDKITHVYFNNLSRVGGVSKSRENAITVQLEAIEATNRNVAVITLPSDNGMLSRKPSSEALTLLSGDQVFNKISAITNKSSTETDALNFYIGDNIRNKLFSSKKQQEITMQTLLANSFVKLGFNMRDEQLNFFDRQAIFFHFIKYELTNYILETLKPDTFNFSCKDAIDRGSASSAYYNLLKSISLGKPLSQNEFECILHGASIIVKGRTMNDHIKLVWNCIDAYLEANKNSNNIPAWLFAWRKQHAIPHSPYYYAKKLEEYVADHAPLAPKSIFSSGTGIGVIRGKLAENVLTELNEHLNNKNCRKNKCTLTISQSEFEQLHSNSLGKLIIEMENDDILAFRIDNTNDYKKSFDKV